MVTRDCWHFVVILGLSSVVITLCRSHYTTTAPRSEWVVINHMSPNFICRWLSWLRSGHRCSQDCLLDSPAFQAEARPPERVASHDFHQPLHVSGCSAVSGFYIGSSWWLQRHCHVPTTRCRREINLLPCSRIKVEFLPLWSKTDPSSTFGHLSDSRQRSSAVDSSTFNDHRLSCSIQRAQHSLSLVIHFCLCLQCSTNIRVNNLCESNTRAPRSDGQEQQFYMQRYQCLM